MDDMKDKVKGFMKKMNNPFTSSSSGKFTGQGRFLGSSSSSSSGGGNQIPNRPYLTPNSNPSRPLAAQSNPKPLPQRTSNSDRKVQNIQENDNKSEHRAKTSSGFDPFDSLITSGNRNRNGYELNVCECPFCGGAYGSQEEISDHVESCLATSVSNHGIGNGESASGQSDVELRSKLEACVGTYLSGKPSVESSEVVLKLLRNIAREPQNEKFRKIRMGNPKIKDAVTDVVGGVELLECLGFELKEDGGEICAVMEVPSDVQIAAIKNAITVLEPQKIVELPSTASHKLELPAGKKMVDRQIRVFFAVPESVAAKIELPDSFYIRSSEEIRREAEMRKKKIAESQLLIPKSYKEKQAKASRKRYSKTIIRVQFPDGVLLQGIFSPLEPTSALYEFVSSALKEQCLEFELLHPVLVKRRVIPSFPSAGARAITLEEEDLVPAALIKFRPIESDSIVFTGLHNDLLEISEPLTTDSAPV